VPKGPRVAGLVELTTRRPEFRPLVSYRSYRLAIRTQTVYDQVTSKVNSYLKMMRHHVTEKFTGEHEIRIFDFLTVIRDAFDVNRISEGAAYLLLPHFLSGKVKHGSSRVGNRLHRHCRNIPLPSNSYCRAMPPLG
jgi:hypothetical protein